MDLSESDISLEWLHKIVDFENPVPLPYTPFVRTTHINNKRNGCLICPNKRVTRHHIRRGPRPLAVYICWKHHQILHGVGLHRFKTEDIFIVLVVAREQRLFKESEARVVEKLLITELERRRYEENTEAFMKTFI